MLTVSHVCAANDKTPVSVVRALPCRGFPRKQLSPDSETVTHTGPGVPPSRGGTRSVRGPFSEQKTSHRLPP